VLVDGEPAILGQRVDPTETQITVDGVPVAAAPDLVHYLLNKPAGVVATASDPQGRPTVLSLVPSNPRVFPVGRLDRETEGLLVVTNDGDLAQLLAHPSHGVEKEYMVWVQGEPARGALRRLRQGVELDDGMTAPATVGSVAPGLLRMVIHEGRNRQIRRMCDAVGHPVKRLVRVRIGPLSDTELKPGEWRDLSKKELRALSTAAAKGGRVRPPGPPPKSQG
jgi:23S rRNA pseudouridine2605 synthase